MTWAQNDTEASARFLQSAERYCEERSGELFAIKGNFRTTNSRKPISYDEKLAPYLVEKDFQLGRHLTVFASCVISPVKNPLGALPDNKNSSSIGGSPRIQLKPQATARRDYPRLRWTTGSITPPNYAHGNRGRSALPHHVVGATVVEIDSKGLFYPRHILADAKGGFYDLDRYYSPTGSRRAERALGLVCGDEHVAKADWPVVEATFFGKNSVVGRCRPRVLVRHDVFDGESCNHHTQHDFKIAYEKALGTGTIFSSVAEELRQAADYLTDTTPRDTESWVVASNHDDFLDRWIDWFDKTRDPLNTKIHNTLENLKIEGFEAEGFWRPAFEHYCRQIAKLPRRISFLNREDPKQIAQIYVHLHGDKGINGTRGTDKTGSELGCEIIDAHGHAAIQNGWHSRVGVKAKKNQGYNALPTLWTQTDKLIYPNGKTTFIFYTEGKFTPFSR